MSDPTVYGWMPSDVLDWKTVFDASDRPHVVPQFGPKHRLSRRCWCHPVIDDRYTEPAVSHNVAN